MNRRTSKLPEAFAAIRQGEFERAFELADSELKKDPENFWGWYLAAIAVGFLDRRSAFKHYLERARILNVQSPYVIYLAAYTHLWENNLESALMDWTSLVDRDEGWLARELIEKARKGVNLIEKAGKGDISFFIVLPEFIENPARLESEIMAPVYEEIPGSPRNSLLKKIHFVKVLYLVFFASFAGLVFFLKEPVLHYLEFPDESKSMVWKNFKIDEWAALVNPQKKDAVKYVYTDKDKLIEDFEDAKKKLSDNKFNQARFLLQRILYSNADFKTKEKSKIFINFIPEPDYQDFADPLFPDKLMETPEFYTDCLVLWQGSVLKIRDVDHGKEVGLLIKDSNTDYLVDAFLQEKDSRSNWLPFADYQKKKELREKKPQAIVYGKFKGIIGKQKTIYLELVQLWM